MTVENDIPFALKASLVDDRGIAYREFRGTLTPRYGRIWAQIALGYLALAGISVGLAIWAPGMPGAILAGLLGAIGIGYTLTYLNNFFHEAGHWNLLPGRERNDFVTNLLMGWLYGTSVGMYRRLHLQHHRALGTTMDAETAYFDALRIGYLLRGISGVKLAFTLRRYRDLDRKGASRSEAEAGSGQARIAWLVLSAAINLAIAAALWLVGAPVAGIAWLAGLLLVFPFLVSLRQLLEHRSEAADAATDYSQVDHGAVNRIFGDGPLASTLGSAGFNRHALHHWEPTVSYTRLRDIEAYMLRTDAAPLIRERQTSYRDAFLRLLEL